MFATRHLALAAALALVACTDRTTPSSFEEVPQAAHESPAVARERLARLVALALANDDFRARLKRDLDRSPVREGKLHFQRYIGSAQAGAGGDLARLTGASPAAVSLDARRAPELELYLPVAAHRAAWKGDTRVLVATTGDERDPPVAFSPDGRRVLLDAKTPPGTPVLALVPVETDFDLAWDRGSIQGGPTGGGSTPPAGLYMTNSHLVETFESWVKGAPEIEAHMLGQSGKTDSLTSYSCAGGHASGYFRFDQNELDWSGNALLITQTQINQFRSTHPGQNFRIFFVEDDDTPCQIKVDPARFSNLIKAVELVYPLFTGGRDTTSSGISRIWKRANALQRIIKALASAIKTDDELIGNAIESTVVGEVRPNSNWIIKGDGNKTNGWIKLVMK